MPQKIDLIAIGELARRTGFAGSALRYYERMGLLSPAARYGGRRHYYASSAERVALIRLCQDAGFTLREMRALLAHGSRRSRAWTRMAKAKVCELDSRIAQARRARAMVQHAIACPHRNLATCPNFWATLERYLRLHDSIREPCAVCPPSPGFRRASGFLLCDSRGER